MTSKTHYSGDLPSPLPTDGKTSSSSSSRRVDDDGADDMSDLPILIIGAGLAGLTLARSLAKSQIPAIVFEASAKGRAGGHGLSLQPRTYHPLCELLGTPKKDFVKALAVDSALGGTGRIYEPKTLSAAPSNLSRPPPTDSSMRVNKRRLVHLLADEKELDIRWNHRLVSVDHANASAAAQASNGSSDSCPVAVFENGERVKGRWLFGADGVHSKSRFVKDAKRWVKPIVAINGQRKFTREDYDSLLAPHMRDSAKIYHFHDKATLELAINDSTPNSVTISHTYLRPARIAKGEDARAVGVDAERDAICTNDKSTGSQKKYDDPLFVPFRETGEAKDIPQAYFDELRQLGDLPSPYKELFDADKVKEDRLNNWLLRYFQLSEGEEAQYREKKVTILGDAARAMPIVAGYGGNDAILTALAMGKNIADAGSEKDLDKVTDELKFLGDDQERCLRNLEALCKKI